MKSRDVVLILLLLWLLSKRADVSTTLCYIDPDTGECLPVPDETIL